MITLIAAAGEKNELGKLGFGNNALWDLPDDYNRFKELTLGHPVIMGRKTFGTLDDILEGRLNIVISRNPDFKAKGAEVFPDLEKAVQRAFQTDENIFITVAGRFSKWE